MVKKGYKQTEEHKKKLSKVRKDKIPWNKGIPQTKTCKEKISLKLKGRKSPWTSIPCSEERRKNISIALSGQKRKPLSEIHKNNISITKTGKLCGSDNPNWRGGTSKNIYSNEWTEKLREKIRNRDNRICQECGKTELENNRKLSVHHIHYDKENCNPDLISLCCSCSAKVNYNRNYWEEYFMKKLKERNLLSITINSNKA